MARSARSAASEIRGIPDSWKQFAPYNDLNEVLNKIGVMAKRYTIPFARITHLPKKKKYNYRAFDGFAYVVPEDWRNCLYEDLETGDYYIVSPDPKNDPDYKDTYSWIAFKLSGLTDGIIHYEQDDSGRMVKKILHHSGSFIDLMWRCSLNEILDTLAETKKPIVIKVSRYLYDSDYNERGAVCQFEI